MSKPTPRSLTRILRDIAAADGTRCPDCDGTPEFGGGHGANASYRCTYCELQWESWEYQCSAEEMESPLERLRRVSLSR